MNPSPRQQMYANIWRTSSSSLSAVNTLSSSSSAAATAATAGGDSIAMRTAVNNANGHSWIASMYPASVSCLTPPHSLQPVVVTPAATAAAADGIRWRSPSVLTTRDYRRSEVLQYRDRVPLGYTSGGRRRTPVALSHIDPAVGGLCIACEYIRGLNYTVQNAQQLPIQLRYEAYSRCLQTHLRS